MTYQTKISNIIQRLKEVKDNQPDLTLQKISDHTGVSFTTVSRVFRPGSEADSFRYESIRPIAQMLLGIDDLDEGGDDEKALKAIIQFKDTRIRELETALKEEKAKHERKLEKERNQSRTSIDFLKHQVELKDKRIDLLMDAIESRRVQYEDLMTKYQKMIDKVIGES